VAEHDVYLLGHEDLQQTAVMMFGPRRLSTYRQRLHEWAEDHRIRGWPTDTPEYLLRGWFRLLTSTGDTARMVVCGTDQARHERMAELSGTDAAALDEIRTAMDAVAASAEVDLVALARLAVHRDHLQNRNVEVPDLLPAVWERLGEPERAEALARLIIDPVRRITATLHLAAAAGHSNVWRARRLRGEARLLTESVRLEPARSAALAALVDALAAEGEPEEAVVLAGAIARDGARNQALGRVARALAGAGAFDRAVQLARSCTGWPGQSALSDIALALAAAGDLDGATALCGSLPPGPTSSH
jgi:hypothetical protein